MYKLAHVCISQKVRKGLSPADINRRVFISLGNVLGFITLLFFGIRDLSFGRDFLGIVELSAGGSYIGNVLLLRYYSKSRPVFRFGIIQGMFLFLFLGAFRIGAIFPSGGGFISSSLFWSFIIPLVCFFLTGKKEGIWWTLSYYVALILLLYAGPAKYFIQYDSEVKLEFLISFLIISLLTYLLESLRFTSNARLEKKNRQLAEALDNVKTLSGLVPICSSCRKIRDDKGYWESLEEYLQSRTDVRFSHGLCDDCLKKEYPEIFDDVKSRSISDNGLRDES